MDPLTHALVGVGVAALTGEKFSLANPLCTGAVLGALAPDFDIIMQLFGDLPYLTHHRGSSHSIPGVLVSSVVIALLLWLVMGGSMGLIFVLTLMGAISHVLLDILNSYGAKILWPFSQKKYSLHLLVLADPVIIILFSGMMIWPGLPEVIARTGFWIALIYLGLRVYFRHRIFRMIWRKFKSQGAQLVVVMPAMVSLWNWSFLVETPENFIIGEVLFFSPNPGVKKILAKCQINDYIGMALHSKLGRLFRNFTPFFHIHHSVEDGKNVVRFCDLRYFFKEDFLHNATIVFDETQTIIDAVFQPYSRKRKIRITG